MGSKQKKKRALCLALIAALVAGMGLGLPASATGAAIDQKKEEQAQVRNRLSGVQLEKQENIGENEQLLEEKDELDGLKTASELTHSELLEKLRYYEAQIESANRAYEDATALCAEQAELFKSRVRSMYMDSSGNALELLLESKDITSFLEKIELYSVISEHDKDVLEDYKLALADVDYKRSMQMAAAEETEARAAEQRQAIDELNLSRAELEARLDSIQGKIDQLDGLEDELQRQSKKLESEIQALVEKAAAEAAAKAAKEAAEKKAREAAAKAAAAEKAAAEKAAAEKAAASGAGGGGSGSASGSSASGGSAMRWPLPGYFTLSSTFGTRTHPVTKTVKKHTGIDIPAPTGTSIAAAKGGTVIISGVQGGYGNTVVISHGDGLTTLYGHCSKLLVKSGQTVQQGAVIAKVGSTGVSTGPHLHFEVRKNGSPVQPLDYVKAG
ncbi:MAG: peptidoglycan DD-metalloendopeptidase family protein [Clostridiales bacterium]|jgi:murein DD-endopeptidase MepM/ murein hydrolase activator NlpD|nr:peptidoglycan DD-metalloendopeptidase family protein [Clostridiales bacterium]